MCIPGFENGGLLPVPEKIDFRKIFHMDIEGNAILPKECPYDIVVICSSEIEVDGDYVGLPTHCENCALSWLTMPDLLAHVVKRYYNLDGERN